MTAYSAVQIRRFQPAFILILGLMTLIAAQADVPNAEAQTGDEWATAGMVKMQAVNLHVSGDASMVSPGAARQKSSLSGAWVDIHTSGLDANAVYTIWAVVFNHPDACVTAPESPTRCGMADLTANPNPVEASAFAIGGFIASADGTANIGAAIQAGLLPEGTDVLWGVGGRNDNGVAPGLRSDNGLLAEIHYVLRTHGSPIAGSVAEQLSTVDGGCEINECANQQAAGFPPAAN